MTVDIEVVDVLMDMELIVTDTWSYKELASYSLEKRSSWPLPAFSVSPLMLLLPANVVRSIEPISVPMVEIESLGSSSDEPKPEVVEVEVLTELFRLCVVGSISRTPIQLLDFYFYVLSLLRDR